MLTILSLAFVAWVIHSLRHPWRMCYACKGKNGARIHSNLLSGSFHHCRVCKGSPKRPRVLTRLLGRHR